MLGIKCARGAVLRIAVRFDPFSLRFVRRIVLTPGVFDGAGFVGVLIGNLW